MNTETLYRIADFLIASDEDYGIRSWLAELKSALTNLASEPENATFQKSVASAQETLERSIEEFDSMLQPYHRKELVKVGGTQFFGHALMKSIDQVLTSKGLTPSVANQRITELQGERDKFLAGLRMLRDGMTHIGLKPKKNASESLEFTVIFPRMLFQNQLGPLAKELSVFNNILRIFAEVANSSGEPINVEEISTSDPAFLLGVPLATVYLVVHATDWLTKKWKELEEIKKLRAEAKRFEVDDAVGSFDKKIQELTRQAIEHECEWLLKSYNGDAMRRKELNAGLTWALESLMARLERGLSIEIRFLPPKKDSAAIPKTELVEQIEELAENIQPLEVLEDPVLKLPPVDPPIPKAVQKASEPAAEDKIPKKKGPASEPVTEL